MSKSYIGLVNIHVSDFSFDVSAFGVRLSAVQPCCQPVLSAQPAGPVRLVLPIPPLPPTD
ncbi:hypothetical protein E2C01_058140 [Portunus trituberculatus]|uniref:Uncharacterized protein n=1 Tax=Portunus trituberculatus TaxID=210409 RepID=A0A5B7GVE1_PORTR|nr:hypothetical protein [Portunus trituberculatus]